MLSQLKKSFAFKKFCILFLTFHIVDAFSSFIRVLETQRLLICNSLPCSLIILIIDCSLLIVFVVDSVIYAEIWS